VTVEIPPLGIDGSASGFPVRASITDSRGRPSSLIAVTR
jgi:hypothetical protein